MENKYVSEEIIGYNASPNASTETGTIQEYLKVRRLRSRNYDNYVLIGLGFEYSNYAENFQLTFSNLIKDIKIFENTDECFEFISDIENEQVFAVVSEKINEKNLFLLETFDRINSIYILDEQLVVDTSFTETSRKFSGRYSNLKSISDAMSKAMRILNRTMIPIAVIPQTAKYDINELDPTFMYGQLLNEILLDISANQETTKAELIDWCRKKYAGCHAEIKMIDEFEREYNQGSAVWWYTRECFLYWTLNKACRTQDIDMILKMGFFIRDLHQQIDKLYHEKNQLNSLTVYRGQGLNGFELDKIKLNKNGLLSFNNFLSTSIDRQVGYLYADSARQNPELVGTLFVIEMNPSVKRTHYAYISEHSYYPNVEGEVLISTQSVFRIIECQQLEENLWEIQLVLTNDNDELLQELTDSFRNEIGDGTAEYRLSQLIMKMGKLHKAEEILKKVMSNIAKDDVIMIASINYDLGTVAAEKEEIMGALDYFEKTLDLQKQTLTSGHEDFAMTYRSLGDVYTCIGQYHTAFMYYEKAFNIQIKLSPIDYHALSVTYNHIGFLHGKVGEYERAISYYKKAKDVFEKLFPKNHPNLAACHINIGSIQYEFGEYSDALLSYKDALEIQKKSLSTDHLSLSKTYNNIGTVYNKMGAHAEAKSHFERAIYIIQKDFSENHPKCTDTYTNIGLLYQSLGEYSLALEYHQKTLDIEQISFSAHHPTIAVSYINIGSTYQYMGKYQEALTAYRKAYTIQQISLPTNHPDLAITCNNLGLIYNKMGDNHIALSYYERSLQIKRKTLSANHPSMAIVFNNIGITYDSLGHYSDALDYYEKVLAIQKQIYCDNHLEFATTYSNIASAYNSLSEYAKALSYYEKVVSIQTKALSSDHPDLGNTYRNVGLVYQCLEEYSTALSYYEQAASIEEKTLLPDHPNKAITYNNIGSVYNLTGKPKLALEYYEKTLEIQRKSLPEYHDDLAATYNNIGMMYQTIGDYATGLSYLEKVLHIQEMCLPSNHPSRSITHYNLAEAFENLHRYEKAVEHAEIAVKIASIAFGPTHPETIENQEYLDLLREKL